jgi:hypothetical protein
MMSGVEWEWRRRDTAACMQLTGVPVTSLQASARRHDYVIREVDNHCHYSALSVNCQVSNQQPVGGVGETEG